MSEKKKLVVLITRGLDDERSSVAWSVANGAVNTGLDVTLFLTSSAVDWVRKGAADQAHLNPFDPPMQDMIQKMIDGISQIDPMHFNYRLHIKLISYLDRVRLRQHLGQIHIGHRLKTALIFGGTVESYHH